MTTALAAWVLLAAAHPGDAVKVAVGSKAFTESVILGEIATLLAHEAELEVRHKDQLGGSPVVWNALVHGEIDVYAEYIGTLAKQIFKRDELLDESLLRVELARHGIAMTQPLGFNNSYAIGMRQATAQRYGITKISDLGRFPKFRFGFSNEFKRREEGWPAIRARYRLPQRDISGLQHTLCYRALAGGDIEAMDVYTTDPEIQLFNLVVLDDDAGVFPRYDAVFLYRQDLAARAPRWVDALSGVAGQIDDATMIGMNARVTMSRDRARRYTERRAAADFLAEHLHIHVAVAEPGWLGDLWINTYHHMFLVVVSLVAAIVVAVPLGIFAARNPGLGQFILAVVEVIQTIPGLALLVLLMPIVAAVGFNMVGPAPAIVALFLYSLLPILRNTFAGMNGIARSLRESAAVLGLPPRAQLRLVEIPMAAPMILAGIKTTAVINVGYATLGGLIGAGGFGEPIMEGLRLQQASIMLQGAVPAAILALVIKIAFELIERKVVPKGLRL